MFCLLRYWAGMAISRVVSMAYKLRVESQISLRLVDEISDGDVQRGGDIP
jgi:hypothetical protein